MAQWSSPEPKVNHPGGDGTSAHAADLGIGALPWYGKSGFRQVALLLFWVVLLIEGIVAIGIRENDFLWHYQVGVQFHERDPYRGPVMMYPVGRTMLNGLVALMPHRTARAVCYLLTLGALLLTMRLWNRMAQWRDLADDKVAFAAWAGALVLLYPNVIRDLDDCGIQLLLLFFLTAAGYALFKSHYLACGFWLGLGITYKSTPLLFLPLLVWQRQWRALAWTGVWILTWNVALPAFYLGIPESVAANQIYLSRVRAVGGIKNPSETYEPPRHQNQGLKMALARFLQTYPPGHDLHLEHHWFVQFGNLTPVEAHYTVLGILLMFAGVLAWRFWHRWGLPGQPRGLRGEGDFALDWAAVTLLSALLSPICWLHHLVLALPCFYLSLRADLFAATIPRWRWGVLAVIAAVVLGLQRDVVQRELSVLLLSYKIDTLAALLILLLATTATRPLALKLARIGPTDFVDTPEPSTKKAAPRTAAG